MITKQHTQECLTRAFIHALTGGAGVNCSLGAFFDYGFDGQFKPVIVRGTGARERRVESGFHLDFQLKSTTLWEFENDHVVYDLEAKTYNDFVTRDPDATGAILILLCLPEDEVEWANFTEDHLALRHCCYWAKLNGDPTDNANTKRVRIPRTNLLTVDSLKQILNEERGRRLEAEP